MAEIQPIRVHQILGRVPPAWQRDVIFFANILGLFYGNESQMEVLRREVGTLETYGNRLIPIINLLYAGTENLLVLEQHPDEAITAYFQKELELTLPAIQVLSHADYLLLQEGTRVLSEDLQGILELLRGHPSPWIDGYVTDEALDRLARLTGKKTVCALEGSRCGNNKLLLHRHKREHDLPVFDTHVAEDSTEVLNALDALKTKGYTIAVVKSQIGASGIGMIRVRLSEIPKEIPGYIFHEGPCLVQGWLDETYPGVRYVGSPSVQMLLNNDAVYLYDFTEQLLSKESVHEGNIAPPRFFSDKDKDAVAEILRQAEVAGRWLHAQGYRGTASCDFHVIERAGTTEVRLCELNARVTGATYPSLLSRHFLPRGAWLMRNIRFAPPVTGPALLKTLKEEGFLFAPGKEQGVLPFNFNFDQANAIVKGQFLFLGPDTQTVARLLEELTKIQSIHGSYDRD